MGKKEFLSSLGFDEDPFQFTNADQEEHLQTYFIPPPYFDSVWGDPDVPQSHVIFAPRGGGKSAQRRMIEYRAQEADVFAITYDRFEGLSKTNLSSLGTDYHLANLIRISLIGFLLEIKARNLNASAFSTTEREAIAQLVGLYLGKISRLEATEALKSLRTLSAKAKDLLADWSAPISALASTVMAAGGLPPVKLESSQVKNVQEGGGAGSQKAHFEVVHRLIKSIGFKSVYVLVDKVDETAETNNSAEQSFLLIKPLVCDLELLQSEGVGFKFFLWDKLESYHRAFARPDRIQQFHLSWTKDELNSMLSRRLSAFSAGRVNDLSQLTDADLARPLQFLVVLFASGSPRDMIRICQSIQSEQLHIDANPSKVGLRAIKRGIEKFSTQRAGELLPDRVLKELSKVGQVGFTTNYVANDVFKIDANSARNKINQWMQTGTVEKTGELHTGTKPIYHYALTDIRVAMTCSQLNLFDFLEQKVNWCFQCAKMMLRDWDAEPRHTCHHCGTESLKAPEA